MYPKLKNRPWKVVKSENILRLGPWLSVRQECVEMPSGKQIPTWYVMEFPDWINVIAITKDGKMVMEDQYRHALGETHYELVAGVVDPGETPLEAAKRELSEETGYEGGEWKLFMTLSPNPTNHNNLSYTFLATGVEKVREQHQEPTEDIHVDIMEPEQVLEMLRDGEIIQALHAAPLWKYFYARTGAGDAARRRDHSGTACRAALEVFLFMRFAIPIAPVGHTRRHRWHPTHFVPIIFGLRFSSKAIA